MRETSYYLIANRVVKPNEGQESWIYKYQCKQNVITLSSDLWQVGGFLQILRFPPQIKLTTTI